MRRSRVWCFGIAALLCSLAVSGARGQVLIWSDEFDGPVIDSANWGHMFGNGCEYGNCGWGNNELEYYTTTANNSFVADGSLHIVARREFYEGFQFTSARLQTRYRHNFLYGRLEARIKLPTGGGIWPAFWMMPAESVYGGWASSGEIDIVEMVNNANTIYGTIHFGGNWPNNTNAGGQFSNGTDYAQDFHVFSIEWEPDVIRWYVDGTLYNTETSATWYSAAAPGNDRAPFDQPFYFLLNVAVGGNWPGCTNPSCITATFPQEMLVDWVRVYQISPPDVAIIAPAAGATLPVGPVTIEATAVATVEGATIDHVEFYVNGILAGQDDVAPYQYAWEPAEGCYGLKAKAVDSTGQQDETPVIAVTIGAGCATIPYYYYPQAIPGKIEAEDFDRGGEGVGYHDTTAGNSGNSYRTTEGVDIEGCAEGGFNIGWMSAGEWLRYTVAVANAAEYTIEARVSSPNSGGRFSIEFDGVNLTGTMVVPQSGGWQNWRTITAHVQLTPGVKVMRFVNSNAADGYNVNYLNIKLRYPYGDIDQDGDVDLGDHAAFVDCLSGPNQGTPPAGCSAGEFARSDFDGDGDVDARDYGVVQEILP